MNQPPAFITLELNEQDVYKDLTTILESMMKMRMKSVKDNAFTDEEKDEYLHLAYRFASGLEAIADEAMVDDMQEVASSLDNNKELLFYDPLQDGFWKQEGEKKFVSALDDLAVAVSRDDFHDLDVKHHILQAVKYLGVKDEPFETKKEMFATVQPFHGGIPVSKENIARKTVGLFFGVRYLTERVNPLTLKVDGPLEFLDDIIIEAAKKGYVNVQFPINNTDFEGLDMEKKKLVGKNTPSNKEGFGSRLFKYTKVVSYPLLGLLPQRMQVKLNQRIPAYKPFLGSKVSAITEGIAGVGFVGTAIFSSTAFYLLGGALMVDTVLRAIGGIPNGKPVGSALLKGIFYPFESGTGLVADSIAEVPVRKPLSYQELASPLPYFEALSSVLVPSELEENLVISTKNHSNFGKKFRPYVEKEAKEYKPQGLKVDSQFLPSESAIAYHHEVEVDDYTRRCSLFCLPGERYAVTTISRNSQEGYLEGAAKILNGEGDVPEKASALVNLVGSKYIHLKRYKNGELTHDLEGVN